MTSSQQRRVNYSRRFAIFLTAIVLAILAYTAAWYYAAGWIKDEVEAAIVEINSDGRRAACENLEIRGYPFRVGVFCGAVMYIDAQTGLAVRAGPFRSAAQVYDPTHAIGELDGPAILELPGLVALDVDWDLLRASIRMDEPLPQRLSVEVRSIVAAPNQNQGTEAPMISAQLAEFHMRPSGADVDLALRLNDLEIDPQYLDGAILPPLDGLADISISNALLPRDWPEGLRGLSGTVRNATLSFDDGAGASISGPFSIDELGLIDAELEVVLREPAALASIIGELFPEARDEIDMSLTALAAMGEAPTVPLRIDNGEVRLGFLPLGSIPPL